MKPRPRGTRAALSALCLGVLLIVSASAVAVPDPAAAPDAPPAGRCADRKDDVLGWNGYVVQELVHSFTSSLRDPGVAGAAAASRTMRRIERQLERATRVCPLHRLTALRQFVRAARPLTRHQMGQTAVEALLRAFDRYESRQTHRPVSPSGVADLHRCQDRLPALHMSYEIGYSEPKPYGKDGWVMLAVENSTARDLWVSLDGWMVAVRPLPAYAGELSPKHGGHVYRWGGSSSDLMLAAAHRTTEHYASPSWYLLRLRPSGSITTVRPRMIVAFPGRLGCAAPVWP